MVWLKVRQAAAYAGNLSERTVYTAIRSGKLRAARIGAGRNVVTSQEWIDTWLGKAGGVAGPALGEGPTPSTGRAA